MIGHGPRFVTGVPGIPRTRQLKIIGNGVVPQQAALALRLLIEPPPSSPRPACGVNRACRATARPCGASRRAAPGSRRRAGPPGNTAARRGRARDGARPRRPAAGRLPAHVHPGRQGREPRRRPPGRRGSPRPARGRRRPRRALPVRQRAHREDDRFADGLRPLVQAGRVPGRDADQRPGRDRPDLHPRRRRLVLAGRPGAAAGRSTSTSPPQASGRYLDRNKPVSSAPRCGSAAVTHSQAPPSGTGCPARDSTSTSSSPTSSPVSPIPGYCRKVLPSCASSCCRTDGPPPPVPGGRQRRSTLDSRPPVKPARPPRPSAGRPDRAARAWRGPVAADLTRRAESSVDAAGPGRQASRTSRPARGTAFVARCRSAPSTAARDPRRPRPAAAGGRGEQRRP